MGPKGNETIRGEDVRSQIAGVGGTDGLEGKILYWQAILDGKKMRTRFYG